MQKFIASLVAAFMMAAGLVAFSGSSATAACPYTGCIKTYTKIDAPAHVKRGNRAKIGVRITTAGNGTAKGRVTLSVKKKTGGYHFIDNKKYTGGKIWFTTTKLRKLGKYVVLATFDRKPESAFKDSDNTDAFRVVRR